MLDGNSEKKTWIATLPWKEQFSRFMLLKPNTRNDEKLFLAIVEFLSKLSESPEFEPVIKDLIKEGKENLITMLNREQPDTGKSFSEPFILTSTNPSNMTKDCLLIYQFNT